MCIAGIIMVSPSHYLTLEITHLYGRNIEMHANTGYGWCIWTGGASLECNYFWWIVWTHLCYILTWMSCHWCRKFIVGHRTNTCGTCSSDSNFWGRFFSWLSFSLVDSLAEEMWSYSFGSYNLESIFSKIFILYTTTVIPLKGNCT